MTEEIINELPAKLKDCICTLKKSSMDTTNKNPMCESKLKVVNFDRIPKEYARGRGWSGIPKSNDALYIDVQGKWFFIEFKNGTIHKDEIYRKLYDSLIILIEYGKIQQAPARNQTYGYFMNLANQEERLFDIDKFEKYLFKETHTYTQNQFEYNFVRPKEEEERRQLI